MYELRHQEHEKLAAYKPDLAIGIAWGIEAALPLTLGRSERGTFDPAWAAKLGTRTRHFLYIFYNGGLVHRQPARAAELRQGVICGPGKADTDGRHHLLSR